MTLDDYLEARMISTPLRLFDCDIPCDGSTAIIVSHVETSTDLRRAPLRVESVGCAMGPRATIADFTDGPTSLQQSGDFLWAHTTVEPADVQVAELYDGFSIITLQWLEALRFCAPGAAGDFVYGGHRIARDGRLPLNTQGGQLSGGRLHGLGFLHEACTQLWGDGGARQVPGSPRVAVASAGGETFSACLLLVSG
jgi:acetyl-CoA acetyltransferase